MATKYGLYIFDGNGLKEVPVTSKRAPLGAWYRSTAGWEQFRIVPREGTRRYEWVQVSQDKLPSMMRTSLLLLGLS